MLPSTVHLAQRINIQIQLVYFHFMPHNLYNPLILVLLINPYKSQIRSTINSDRISEDFIYQNWAHEMTAWKQKSKHFLQYI